MAYTKKSVTLASNGITVTVEDDSGIRYTATAARKEDIMYELKRVIVANTAHKVKEDAISSAVTTSINAGGLD